MRKQDGIVGKPCEKAGAKPHKNYNKCNMGGGGIL